MMFLSAGRVDEVQLASPIQEDTIPVYTHIQEEDEIDYEEFMKKNIKSILISLVAIFFVISTVNAYTILKGDNLSKIAESNGISLVELVEANPQIENVNLIYPGQEINIPVNNESTFGGTTPISGSTYNLAGAGVSSSATSIILSSFTITQTGHEILTADLGDKFYITIEPGNKARQEIVSCTTVTQSASSATATLSGCTRGLKPYGSYGEDSNYKFSHAGGSQVILSDPPHLFNLYTAKANNETVDGFWDFTYLPSSSVAPTSTSQFVTKIYVDNSSNQGAATSTESVAGISELATANETASSTSWNILEPHVIQSQYATSTPLYSCDDSGTAGAKCVVVGESDGKLNQSWLDLSEGYTFSGNVGFTGSRVDMLGTVYTNYLGGSFNVGYSATTLENATGTVNILGDWYQTGNATTTGTFASGDDGFLSTAAAAGGGEIPIPSGTRRIIIDAAVSGSCTVQTRQEATLTTTGKTSAILIDGFYNGTAAYTQVQVTSTPTAIGFTTSGENCGNDDATVNAYFYKY